MRTLLCVLVMLFTMSCNLSRQGSGTVQSVVGEWEIVHMSKTPVALDNLPESKPAIGRMEFKGDGTFEGTISMPGVPPGTNISGTYQIAGDVITINNSLNKSTTRSKLRFEREYMVLEPVTQEPFSFTLYYKRVR